ncbi:MAG: hypothetical protein IJ033_06415 [Clostridia bacterium]|nr:hypothetical protein [Clostridia bacterium]
MDATNKNFTNSILAYFTINPLDISTLKATVKTAEDIQAKYGYDNATSYDDIQAITYNGYQQRPNVIFVTLQDASGVEYELYRTVLYGEQKGIYRYTDATIGSQASYRPFFRIVNLDIDEYGDVNGYKDEALAYSNNVSTCTYNGSNGGACASFQIMIDSATACSNLTGTATVYFNIATLDLSNYKYTIENQALNSERVYKGEAWYLEPEVVYVTVPSQNIWVYQNSKYIQYANYSITYAFKNSYEYSKKYKDNKPVVEYSDAIRAKCGVIGIFNDTGRWEDANAGSNGAQYFEDFSGAFTINGAENGAEKGWSNNINVTRDGGLTGTVVAGAGVIFVLDDVNVTVGVQRDKDGYIITDADDKTIPLTATTLFEINPLDLSGDYDATNNKLIGFFSGDGSSHSLVLAPETYTGAEITPEPVVYAHVKESNSGTVLGEDDFYFGYAGTEDGHTYDNINVKNSGIVYVYGQGNYTGIIYITFSIKALDVSGKIEAAEYLDAFEYTGDKPIYVIKTGYDIDFYVTFGDGVTKKVTLVAGTNNDFESNGVQTSNVDFSTAESGYNYISINLTGLNDYTGGYGQGGNYYSSSAIPVYFAIVPKDISGTSISVKTNWSLNDEQYTQLVYNGKEFAYNALDGDKDNHIILTYTATTSTGTKNIPLYCEVDYDIVGGGANINAGTATVKTTRTENADGEYTYNHEQTNSVGGYIILKGKGNYTGELAVPFTILPRDISGTSDDKVSIDSAVDETTAKYYEYFTGAQITPSVDSVTYVGKIESDTNTITISGLKEGTDYGVTYAENVNVSTGGIVIVTGQGNFTGTKQVPFDIKPIAQTVEFFDPANYNDESYLKVENGTDYADYYINAADKSKDGVRIVAATSAIYPTARPIEFIVTDVNGNATNKAIVSYEEPVIENGKSYTYATITFNNAYGIINIKARQTDALGNYITAEDVKNTFAIYGKRQDSASGLIDLEKVYGNDAEEICPTLASGKIIAYKVESSDTDKVSVSSINNENFVLTYKNATEGAVTITVSHDGHIGLVEGVNNTVLYDDNAYVAFSESFTVNVAKRPLLISLAPITVEYGDRSKENPGADGEYDFEFEYVYTTDGTAGDIEDTATGLVNGDKPEDVISGLATSYNPVDHARVGSYGGEQIYVVYGNVDVLSNNYAISYGTGSLTVTKKALDVFVKMSATATENQIIKVFGEENPTSLVYTFEGLINANDSSSFTNPSINYVDENGKPITKYTSAGTYTVKTTGGEADNYSFNETAVTLIIKKANVSISIDSLSVDYSGSPVILSEATIKGVELEDGTFDMPEDGYNITISPLERDDWGNYTETDVWPENVGSYRVRITFTPAENVSDNYAVTEQDFTNAITINKVAPTITYGLASRFQYTAQPINVNQLSPDIDGVGSNPTIDYISEFWFAETGNDMNVGCESNGTYNIYFSATAPIDIGVYDIICIYRADVNDNYTDLIVRFNKAVEITTGVPTITIKQTTKSFTYNGQGCALDVVNDFGDFIYKPYGGDAVVLQKDNTTIKYLVDGDWTTEAPKNVGKYNIRVYYAPTATDLANNVGSEEKEFANAIEIKPIDISIGNDYIKLNYTGTRRRTYTGAGQPLSKDSDVIVAGVSGGTTPLGSISIRYYKNNIEFTEPKNAGLYDVHVTYHAVTGDNYTATDTKVFKGALEISRVGVTVDLTNTYSYVFNGMGRGAEGAVCHGVLLSDGTYEQPLGTLSYAYRKSGSSAGYSSDLPSAVGTYDVRISYVPTLDDNYMNVLSKEFSKVITITKATPSIIINKTTVSYGETIVVDYTIRGAQYDLNGPMSELNGGVGRVVISYGTRFTTADGGAGYNWSTDAPVDSGKYSIKIDFNAGGTSNYVSVSQTAFDILTIENIKPTFTLESKTVTYDGNRHNAGAALVFDGNGKEYTKWDGVSSGKYYYRGTIGYEYRKAGSGTWTTLAPNAVGVYDVRVRYYENPVSDVFSAEAIDFIGALEIKALVINVMPIYGQGHVYDGTSTEGSEIAYVYSYMRDGYKYMVYSRVGDLDRNEVIDLSKAEYVDENGYVYTIVTDADMLTDAWRDYYERMITLVSGSFLDGDELITLEFADLGVTEGKGEFTATNGKNYVVDLDLDVVYIENENSYTLKNESGYYFSLVDGEGKVNVIEIITSNIVYATGDTTKGTYAVTTAGKQTIYTINLSEMTASANGEVYDIYRNVHIISYQKGSSNVDIKVDFSSFYYVSADGKAIYKNANGETFLIDVNTSEVQKVAALNVDTVSFEYVGYNNTQATATVDTSALEAIYANNAYIGKYKEGNFEFIVNLKAKTVRVQTYYLMSLNGIYYQFQNSRDRQVSVALANMTQTETKGLYTYTYGGILYYLDTVNMIAREGANLYTFDAKSSELYQETDGEKVGFSVDVRELTYNVVRNGKLHGTTTLYGNSYDVENATLISGNSWSGTFSILAQGAGEYEIAQGTLGISTNYAMNFVKGVTFNIKRAKLTVSFTGDEDAIYDGEGKFISYEIEGILNDETVGVVQSYDGDNLNVTDGGYRTMITINSTNYYLEGGVSKWYYIAPATMEPIVVPESKPIIYDGAKHYLELKDVERGASISYSGSETAPYFVEPGTYSVIAIVSKPNHVSLEVELKLTIAKAKYEVNAFEVPGTLKYGDALPSLLCDSNLGTIALDPTQVLLPSVTTYTWTFTPYSQEFYKFYEGNSADGNTITGTIELKVQKAQANIEVTGELIQSETNPSAIIGFANGLSNNESDLVTIEYVAGDGTRYAKMPTDPGKYTVRITYAGDENYAETVYTTVLTIEQESNYEWLIYVGSAIVVLTLLSTVFFLVRRQKKFE